MCTNGPQVNTGTIMSYCHLDNSTQKVLQFHPFVENNALIPSMSASGCYTFCEGYEPPVCAITDIAGGVQQACDPLVADVHPANRSTYENAPADGFLVINGEQKPIGNSPQSINLVGLPADGQPGSISAYFSTDEVCARNENNVFTRRDPCCGLFRLSVINPDANTLNQKHGRMSVRHLEWGLLSVAGYQELSQFATTGQRHDDSAWRRNPNFMASGTGRRLDHVVPSDRLAVRLRAVGPHSPPPSIYFSQYTETSPFGPMALRCTSKTSLHTITSEMETMAWTNGRASMPLQHHKSERGERHRMRPHHEHL